MFSDILEDLRALAAAARAHDPEQVCRRLSRLDTVLEDMSRRAAHFHLTLGEIMRATDTSPGTFLKYKNALLTHMTDFMAELDRYMPTNARSAQQGLHVLVVPDPSGSANWLVPLHHLRYHGVMALNIKDPETERLAGEVAELTGTTKTGAVRYALRQVLESLSRPSVRQREERLTRFLEEEIWPLIPPDQLGKPLSKAEREQILGFGEDGV